MRDITDYESMAMLELSEDERALLKARFDEIADSFSALDAFDTDDVQPLVNVLDLQNVMREDISSKTIARDDLLKNAPEQHDGYFRAPAAIE